MKKTNSSVRTAIAALFLGVFLGSLAPAGDAAADSWRGRGRHMGPPYSHGHKFARLPHGAHKYWMGRSYYYVYDGIFYRPAPRGYVVVSAPVGAIIATLPLGYSRISLGGAVYFTFGGDYYRQVPQGYMVVAPPPDVVVQPPPQIYGSVYVNAGRLNVRSGPGSEHPVVFQLRQGTVLNVYGDAPGWYYVQLPNGQFGWVMERFTAPINPPGEG